MHGPILLTAFDNNICWSILGIPLFLLTIGRFKCVFFSLKTDISSGQHLLISQDSHSIWGDKHGLKQLICNWKKGIVLQSKHTLLWYAEPYTQPVPHTQPLLSTSLKEPQCLYTFVLFPHKNLSWNVRFFFRNYNYQMRKIICSSNKRHYPKLRPI